MDLEQVLLRLHELSNPDKVSFKEEKFGIKTGNSLGIYHKDLKVLAKEIGCDTKLGIQLFETGIYEARILCSKICKPTELTENMLDRWVEYFDTWEICDSFCMGQFKYHDLAIQKAFEWSSRDEEFVKRAGLVLMAVYGFADKNADNAVFESFFPVLLRESNDDRVYVKKAVNWAIRQIGKRNQDLRLQSIALSKNILAQNSKAANWIAKAALKELQGEKLNVLDYPRSVYRS